MERFRHGLALTSLLILCASSAFAQGWTDLANTTLYLGVGGSGTSVCVPDHWGNGIVTAYGTWPDVGWYSGSSPPLNLPNGCAARFVKFDGATVDTKRNRLIIWGGGHNSMGDNSFMSLDLSTISQSVATCGGVAGCNVSSNQNGSAVGPGSLVPGTAIAAGHGSMTRLNDPSFLATACTTGCTLTGNYAPWNCPTAINPDTSPESLQSYEGIVYAPKHDVVFIIASPDHCENGYFTSPWVGYAWLVDMTKLGVPSAGNPWILGSTSINTHTATTGQYCDIYPWHQSSNSQDANPTHELIMCISAVNYITLYDVDVMLANVGGTSGVTILTNGLTLTSGNGSSTAVLDPKRRLFYWVGGNGNTALWSVMIDPPYTQTAIINSLTSTDLTAGTCTTWASFPGPGAKFDPSIDRIVGYTPLTATTNLITIFDPVTNTCVNQPQLGGNGPPAVSFGNDDGIYGLWNYVPGLNTYVLFNNASADAFTFKLNANPTYGLGTSTQAPLVCLDLDGDGYGTGPDALGPFTDLVIDATLNTKVTSASHVFTSADIGRVIAVTGGTGFTVQAINTIISVSGGAATLNNPMGMVGSTGGQWQIYGCLGSDADDLDASVHTGAQLIAKWGSLKLGLAHLGYAPGNFWYLSPPGGSPTGNDSNTCHDTDGTTAANIPCATFAHIQASIAAGDMVVFYGGSYTEVNMSMVTGSSGKPILYLQYPGQIANFAATGSGLNAGGNTAWWIVDGMRANGNRTTGGSPFVIGDATPFNVANCHNFALRHIDASNNKWGASTGSCGEFIIENSVFHDNTSLGSSAQHGMYLTNHDVNLTAAQHVVVRNVLGYNNGYHCLQFNGIFSNVSVDHLRCSNNQLRALSLLTGVKNSSFSQIESFDNWSGTIVMLSYLGFCEAYYPLQVNAGCPGPQNQNTFSFISTYNTGHSPGSSCDPQCIQPALEVQNSPASIWSSDSRTIGTGSMTFNVATWNSSTTYANNLNYLPILIYMSNYYIANSNGILNQVPTSSSGCPGGAGCFWQPTVTPTWTNGCRVKISEDAQPRNLMIGNVTSSVGGTSVTVNIDTTLGSGTFTDWNVELCYVGDMGSNTFANNIYDVPGSSSNNYAPIQYDGKDANDTQYNTWLSTSTFSNFTYNQIDVGAGTSSVILALGQNLASFGYNGKSCTQFAAISNVSSCNNADPKFLATSTSYWNTPNLFNLRLQGGSSALAAGIPIAFPAYDVIGTSVPEISPNEGAYQTINPCTITPISLGPWTNTQIINQNLTQAGCPASTWSLSGAWPTGLSGCNSGSGTTCTVSGTINMPSGGTSTPSVSYATATNNYSITVNPVPSITTSCPLPNGNQLQAYSDTLTNSGGTAPVAWSLSSGSLPNGLTLSAGGVISGTPTLSGTSNFTLQVTDANNISATKSCSLFIIQTIPQLGTVSGKTVSGQTR